MKSKVKIVLLIIGIIAAMFLILTGSFWYVTKCKYTDIDTQTSPDGRCQLTLQMKGQPEFPFGSTNGRIVARYDGGVIRKIEFAICDDGATLGKENWEVVWGVAGVQVTLKGSEQDDQVIQMMYDGTEAFSGYSQEQITAENYEEKIGKEEDDVEENSELTDEAIQFYLSLTPDCSYETADGIEYRMIPVDRACGSSFYVLIATADGGRSASMANLDPYLGSGGGARWISFLQDGRTGFSCLSYSGGTYGKLYRTEDGGESFEAIEYPSAKAKLSDGTYYNPFVMPEKVYEEDGRLYMEVGQGPNGDYYGEEGYCHGLYESEDNGRIWTYLKEIAP